MQTVIPSVASRGNLADKYPNDAPSQIVEIKFHDSVAESVSIAGTFNDWRPEVSPMISLDAGRWAKRLVLPPGTYEYCLVVDGRRWIPDPDAPETIASHRGGISSILRVSV